MPVLPALLLFSCSDSKNPLGETAPAPTVSGYRESLIDRERLEKPWGKALGDMDGDGYPDALVGTLDGPIYLYRYPDWKRSVLSPRHGGDDLKVGDLDGDGRPEVVSNGSAIAWYRNPGATPGAWTEHVLYRESGSHDLAIADIDGDGRPDIAARVENGPTLIFFQNAGGSWETSVLHLASGGTGLALGDIDGDGRMDVAENGFWLKHPPDPRRDDWPRREIREWNHTCAAGIADMNGDGKGDVFLARGHGMGRFSWFAAPSDPDIGVWEEHFIDSAAYVHRFHLVDLDGDGDLDVFFAEQEESPERRVGMFLNLNGDGADWSYAGVSGEGSHNIAIGDIDADGDWDFLGADWTGDTRPRVWTRENQSPAASE